MNDTATTEGTGSGASAGRIAIVAITLAAVLGIILIIEGRHPGEGEETQSPAGTTAPAYQAAAAPALDSAPPPEEWLQAHGSPSGNAAWAPAVRAPFDTLWVLGTGAEIFAPPAVMGNHIYMAGNDRVLRALDRRTGEQLWSRTVICGVSGGVAADSQMVYYSGQDGYVYAIHRTEGSQEWRAGLGYHVFTDAAVFRDTIVLAGNTMGSIAALDASSGEVIWSGTMEGLILGPAVQDTVAVFSTESGQVAAWNPGGDRLWSRSFATQPSAPSISRGLVLLGFSSGKVLALSLATGETVWETALDGVTGRTVVSRPAVFADSVLVAGTCDSRVVCMDLPTGDIIWETAMENWVAVPPAVCDTLVYASCDDHRIHILSLNTGLPLDTIGTGSYSGTPPLLLDGVLYAGNSAGDLVALRGTVPADSTVTEENCPVD